jgi:hypothetical protein
MKWRWNQTMLNLCWIVVAILKMATGRNFQCRESIRDIIIYPHIKFWWYRTMLNLCRHFQNGHHNTAQIQHCSISSTFDMWVDNDVPTLKNFYRSPFSKWSPQYRTNSTLSNFNAISYVGRLWCSELT